MNTHKLDLLLPIRQKLDAIEIHNSKLARFLCRVIPASCPFKSDIKLFDSATLNKCLPRNIEGIRKRYKKKVG